MAFLAASLISNAWYWTGIVGRDLQTVQGNQLTDGVYLLNRLLSEMSIDEKFIPYFSHTQINCVIGQEKYFIPNLAYLEELSFNLTDNNSPTPVRFPMTKDLRYRYFAFGRIDNIQSLPFHYYFERVNGGGAIYLYFLPNETFPLNITGKFLLTNVTPDTDMSLTFDDFYTGFLELALAESMCAWYTISLPEATQLKLESMRKKIRNLNAPDLSIRKFSILNKDSRYSWAQINIGHGYTR